MSDVIVASDQRRPLRFQTSASGSLVALVMAMAAACTANGRALQKDAGAGDAGPQDVSAPSGDSSPDTGASDMALADALDAEVSCSYLTTRYAPGEEFPAGDRCNTCTCLKTGKVQCTQNNCWADGGQTPCTPGVDRTCNEDPTLGESLGACLPNGTCDCGVDLLRSPFTGRCLSQYDNSGNGCEYLGRSSYERPVGSQFSCGGNCDQCRCDAPGVISRTAVACDPASGVLPCTSDSKYVYGDLGGNAPFREQTTLAGWPDYLVHVSTRAADGATNSCWDPGLPACGSPDAIDLSDILLDLLDPAVQAVLRQRPAPVLLGRDTRAEGTALFSFSRAVDGAGFLVGGDCAGAAGCQSVPAAVTRLVADLKTFDAQLLASVNCDPWPTPGTFPCFNLSCKIGTEYCTTGAFNGARRYAECRPYPAGCSTCGCAKVDTASVARPYPCFPTCVGLGDDESSSTLQVACTS